MNKTVYILTEVVYGEYGADVNSTRAFGEPDKAESALRKRFNSEVRRARRIDMLRDKTISTHDTYAEIYWTDGDVTRLTVAKVDVE